jgi:hypothetical protein
MTRDTRKGNEGVQDRLRTGLERFGRRLQHEMKGVERRVKDGIESAVREGKHPERRFGRPPSRRPPSGRPPSAP